MHITIFLVIMTFSGITQGYGMSSANQLAQTFNAKYNWDTKKEQDLHNTLIGSSTILGCTIGAAMAGKIISIGRRRTLLMCCAIGIFGTGLSLIENFYMMILGRTIFGLACGIQTVVTPRYIEEYVPV